MAKSDSITFRGCKLRNGCDVRLSEKSGKYVTIYFTSDFSDTVRAAMDWEPVNDGISQAKLNGKLHAHTMILTPTSKQLKGYELQANISYVDNFQVFRIKAKDGDSIVTELRFEVTSTQEDCGAQIEGFLGSAGCAPCSLKVSYTKQEELFDQAFAEVGEEPEVPEE